MDACWYKRGKKEGFTDGVAAKFYINPLATWRSDQVDKTTLPVTSELQDGFLQQLRLACFDPGACGVYLVSACLGCPALVFQSHRCVSGT